MNCEMAPVRLEVIRTSALSLNRNGHGIQVFYFCPEIPGVETTLLKIALYSQFDCSILRKDCLNNSLCTLQQPHFLEIKQGQVYILISYNIEWHLLTICTLTQFL